MLNPAKSVTHVSTVFIIPSISTERHVAKIVTDNFTKDFQMTFLHEDFQTDLTIAGCDLLGSSLSKISFMKDDD